MVFNLIIFTLTVAWCNNNPMFSHLKCYVDTGLIRGNTKSNSIYMQIGFSAVIVKALSTIDLNNSDKQGASFLHF